MLTDSAQSARRAWVTAAASGICLEVTRQLIGSGHQVVLIDRDAVALDLALGRLDRERAEGLLLDVTDTVAVRQAVESRATTRPDILINGVGGDTRGIRFDDLRETDLVGAVTENVLGTFTLTRLCAPTMKERGWGRIVNLASIAGRTYSHFSNAAYVAAKAALVGYTRQCAYELAGTGVTVNAVAHGPIATERVIAAWTAMEPERQGRILARMPMGRHGRIDEAAAAVVHLCAETASYTTGSVVDVNGGMYI